jgi:hypothetical protein
MGASRMRPSREEYSSLPTTYLVTASRIGVDAARSSAQPTRFIDVGSAALSIPPPAVRIGCEGLTHGRRPGGAPLITSSRLRIPS